MNLHQAITPFEDILSSRFFSWWQYSPMPIVYPNSQVFTIMIYLQQNSLSEIVDCTIENYNLYNSLNNT
jgi:hypothetical protein